MNRGSEMKFQLLKKIGIHLVFLISLLFIAWLYKYPEIIFKRPQSVHSWRQTDCTSLALNYYQNGMKFFQPEVHGMISGGATTGKAATSEIPILYYGVALLYKIFGYHDYVYRILITLIFLFGIYSLFLLFEKLNIDPVWNISLSLIFFASPVLVYYGNNFLTDIPAFSFSIAGWNHFLSYYQHKRKKSYLYAMIFLFLAVSMKISAGISVMTLLLLFLLEYTGILKPGPGGSIFSRKAIQILPLIFIILIAGAWAIYARIYNTRNDCTYFSTTIFPIWNMSFQEISKAFRDIRWLWLIQYFHPATEIFFIILFIINMINLKKTNRLFMASSIIVFAGVVIYCVLWFGTFGNHDYYTINLFILPVLIAIVFAEYMNRSYPELSKNLLIRSLMVVLLVFNVQHTRTQMDIRYNGWQNEFPAFKDYYTITPYLRSLGITRFDSVVCMPDQSHHTLYLMNQPGWTIKDYPALTRKTEIRDSLEMDRYIRTGAKYLITGNLNVLSRHIALVPYTRTLYAKYRNIFIFSLPPRELNFILSDSLRCKLHISCDAEKTDSTRSYALYDDMLHRAVAGGFISGNVAHSGVRSIMVNETRPYGFTTALKAGAFDRVTVSSCQYPADTTCYLVVSSQNGSQFYTAQQEIMASESSGWVRVTCQADIPATFDGDTISVYFWNSGKNNVFIDDFEIQIESKYEILNNRIRSTQGK
jgi:hypothetical protein